MARPSKLSAEQWRSVESRLHSGESASALGREFGIDEAAIRRRFRRDSPIVREVAEKLAEAQSALAELPRHQQPIAISLADKLRGISANLAQAAHHGSMTAASMAAAANAQAVRFAKAMADEGDAADPMDHQEKLQSIAALTKIGNDASVMGINLINASKSGKDNDPPPHPTEKANLSTLTDDELAALERIAGRLAGGSAAGDGAA